jgi:hypothetical protein
MQRETEPRAEAKAITASTTAKLVTHNGESLRGRVPGEDLPPLIGPRLKIRSYGSVTILFPFLSGAVLKEGKTTPSAVCHSNLQTQGVSQEPAAHICNPSYLGSLRSGGSKFDASLGK